MNILVVDDEADVRVLFEQRFRREIRSGLFAFAFAQSGEQALEYLHAHTAEINLLLSDVNMPGMTGLELLRRVRNEHAAPHVLMLTAYGDADTYSQAKQLGADDLLTKPVNFAVLRDKFLQLETG